jgi:hypothetical protein
MSRGGQGEKLVRAPCFSFRLGAATPLRLLPVPRSKNGLRSKLVFDSVRLVERRIGRTRRPDHHVDLRLAGTQRARRKG